MMISVEIPKLRKEDNEVDGCELDFLEDDPTPDEELPASADGEEITDYTDEGRDDIDGCVCEIDIEDKEITTDKELPFAEGGGV